MTIKLIVKNKKRENFENNNKRRRPHTCSFCDSEDVHDAYSKNSITICKKCCDEINNNDRCTICKDNCCKLTPVVKKYCRSCVNY